MRVQINETIKVFDGITGEWLTKVLSINRDNTVLRVFEKTKNFIQPLSDLWLIFAPIKQYRMNIAIQKATELGVTQVIPCITDFTNTRNININNLKANAIEAAEQSERIDIPVIKEAINLKSLLENWPDDRYLVYCDEKEKQSKTKNIIEKLKTLEHNQKHWSVLVGPEGGFSKSENELIMKNKNVVPVSLGKRLLRSDTAITVSLFCIEQLLNK